MNNSPYIPTTYGAHYTTQTDESTRALDEYLNSMRVVEQIPLVQRDGRYASPDIAYNLGYHQWIVSSLNFVDETHRTLGYEAPETSRSQLPNNESIQKSRQRTPQLSQGFRQPMRSPGINEGL